MSHTQVGGTIRLGQCIGNGQEPADRMGRLVGIRKGEVREIERYIIRMYEPGDGAFPTGGYRTTSIIFLQPHYPQGECQG